MATCNGGDSNKKDSRSAEDDNARNCCICCEEIKVYSIGACDHPICYKCSVRMRVLSQQTYCATCRAEMKQVVITFQEKKFGDFTLKNMKIKRGGGFYFEEWRLADLFDSLFDYACTDCSSLEKPFTSFDDLKTHIRRVHEKQFCQICLDALNYFPSELKMYTKKELVSHRKDGDVEDRSHRGHPECKFCSDRFVDNDTLLLHLRKSHFWCHFCEHDGKQEYYNVYKDLRTHFGEVHFLCDEGECRYEKFTSVFRNKIDYQAHKLAAHAKNFDKIQAKEARKIEFDYSYRKRQPPSVVTGSDYAEVQSSELKHPRGDAFNNRRDNQNKLDFSTFEDVGKEREELKKERDRSRERQEFRRERESRGPLELKRDREGQGQQELKRERENRQEKGRSPNINERPKRDTDMVASAAPSFPAERQGYSELDDNNVIGMPEHINKPDDRSSKMHDGGNKSKPLKEEMPAEKKNCVQEKPKDKHINQVGHRNAPAVSEDFPLLPGGVPSPDLRGPRKKEEDFPALGKSVRPKEPKPQKQPNKSEITHVNGIPVTVKRKGKEKGKSWTQQSGRANLTSKDDFPTLQSTELKPNVEGHKPNVKLSNPGTKTSCQPHKRPPGYDKGVNDKVSSLNKQPLRPRELTNNTFTSNGKGPPGLGAAGVRKKNDAPPGFGSTTPDSEENNVRERNMRLVALLQTYLDDFNFQIFKNISGEFRKDLSPPSVYYSGISELLGDNLKFVFSELVALLPDEKKREELLKLHQNAKLLAKQKGVSVKTVPNAPKRAVWGSTPLPQATPADNDDETWCADCGETFRKSEAIQHMESHGEAFPSLPTAVQKKKYMPFNVNVHQSQAKNAWTR